MIDYNKARLIAKQIRASFDDVTNSKNLRTIMIEVIKSHQAKITQKEYDLIVDCYFFAGCNRYEPMPIYVPSTPPTIDRNPKHYDRETDLGCIEDSPARLEGLV